MFSVRNSLKLLIVVLSLGLMAQSKNCADLGSLMPQIDKLFGASGGDKVYIANLSFLDADSKSVMPAGDMELINQAVEEGMNTLAKAEPKYVINDPGHQLPNNDANAQKLSNIFWDANLDRTNKINKIISELMEPTKIDGLVAGQFQLLKDGTISVRPFVISRQTKNMVTEAKKFHETEFHCTDPNQPGRKIICEKTREQIRDTVIGLLKQL